MWGSNTSNTVSELLENSVIPFISYLQLLSAFIKRLTNLNNTFLGINFTTQINALGEPSFAKTSYSLVNTGFLFQTGIQTSQYSVNQTTLPVPLTRTFVSALTGTRI